MPDRRQTSLRFPLEESVWFEKGQEVDELISISLDPHITILDEDDYVVLKGSLELNGEYKHLIDNELDEAFPVPGRKYVQAVEVRNEEVSEFLHHFPVDITIPKRRIINVEEMELDIQSFDYVFPENCRLQLMADIYVHGIYEEESDIFGDVENQVEELPDEVESEEVQGFEEEAIEVELMNRTETEEAEGNKEADVAVEARENENDEGHEEHGETVEVDESEEILNESTNTELYEPFTVEARTVPKEEQGNFQLRKDFHFPFPQLPEMSMEALAQRTLEYFQTMERDMESLSQLKDESVIEEMESSSHYQESSSGNESSHEEELKEKVKKKKDKYKTMSFADFFARKEDEASTKLKVCLVQQGDSIQGLADKYKLTVQQILRANQLEASHEVYEGQVLYIPMKSTPAYKTK
ncbi:stage VI sporulation protein D [Lederbergia citrea]|uniref:Stage VI sporulation protein D n=1 Tax=Lederbergia citrea TaxID=2833581 RepID=A0A942UJI0_9BACI|nr:stage VI sporulation protein D [Lederbergia citrea]MBS4176177.1 stage VI sporulation protein D [Lederbergia citrea]MBS4202737.1 stage VI sporulation protein D [Lederbergia citrea]MBS4222595.1 stage VI sporulation protein D [Lederbergia citrea]